ncbi:MAG: DUF3347 domain-containing protein [Flavitalea sp.]
MKRIIAIVLILAVLGIVGYRFFFKKEKQSASDPTRPIELKKNSDSFTGSFDTLMNSYYTLKESFVMADTVQVNIAAAALMIAADSLRLAELKGDNTGLIAETARSFTGTISTSGDALRQEADIEAKRKEFEIISDALWSLVRTVNYDGRQVYYQFCPMAFNDKGAYWLSNTPEIRNPYFGNKMLTCGSTQDSLNLQQ